MYSRFIASFATHALGEFTVDSSLTFSQCNSLKAEPGVLVYVKKCLFNYKLVLIQTKHE